MLEVLAMMSGGLIKFLPCKRGGTKSCNKFWTDDFPIL